MEKKKIGSGETPKTALVTQNFTQIHFEGRFCQNLIICIYAHDKSGKDGLNRVYRQRMTFHLLLVLGKYCWNKMILMEWKTSTYGQMVNQNISR